MKYRVRILQRVCIDVDDEHGEHPGDGAALIDLAELELLLELPFPPFPHLFIQHDQDRIQFEEVAWDPKHELFECTATTLWMQTQAGAESIVDELIARGFSPLKPDHQTEAEIH